MDSALDPGANPNGLVAVRRLNHVPLYIIGTIAAFVALIIGMVAMDKSKEAAARPEDHGGSTDSYAQQAAGERTGYIPAFHTPTPWPMTTPPVTSSTPVPTPDTTEADARKKAFFTALYATSAVEGQAVSAPTSVQVQMPPAPPALPYSDMSQIGAYPSASATPNPNALSTYMGDKDRWTLNNRREMPTTPYLLRTGWVIPALMLTAMESELPGAVTAQVSQDVYDSGTGRYLLIPQGSRLMGEYSNTIQYGQARIFVAWQRIIFPDNSALDISAMPGVDQQGEAGARDEVNNHLLRTFGSALLMSAITAGVTISQPQNSYNGTPSASSALSQSLGQQLGSATSALLERNLSIAPTLKIRPGYRFNILVVKDLIFNSEYHVPNYTKRGK